MATTKNISAPALRLLSIDTEHFELNGSVYDQSKRDNIEMVVMSGFGANMAVKGISTTLRIEIRQEGNIIISVSVTIYFGVDDSTWKKIYKKKQELVTIPKDMACRIVNIAVGTCRGFLHAKTENTEYNTLTIPVLSPEEYVDTDIEIKMVDE